MPGLQIVAEMMAELSRIPWRIGGCVDFSGDSHDLRCRHSLHSNLATH
jgi:hypothetical protein